MPWEMNNQLQRALATVNRQACAFEDLRKTVKATTEVFLETSLRAAVGRTTTRTTTRTTSRMIRMRMLVVGSRGMEEVAGGEHADGRRRRRHAHHPCATARTRRRPQHRSRSQRTRTGAAARRSRPKHRSLSPPMHSPGAPTAVTDSPCWGWSAGVSPSLALSCSSFAASTKLRDADLVARRRIMRQRTRQSTARGSSAASSTRFTPARSPVVRPRGTAAAAATPASCAPSLPPPGAQMRTPAHLSPHTHLAAAAISDDPSDVATTHPPPSDRCRPPPPAPSPP